MDLRFEGDINIWVGLVLATAAAIGIAWLYRRETRYRNEKLAILLPVLRAASILFIILMLTGPVLRGKANVADLSRVLIFLDSSQSMGLTDETMSNDRKLLSLKSLGKLEKQEAVDTTQYDAAEHLSQLKELDDGDDFIYRINESIRHIETACDLLEEDDSLQVELAEAMKQLREDVISDEKPEVQLKATYRHLLGIASSRQTKLLKEYQRKVAESESEFNQFDELSRWQRAESLLLDGNTAVLPALSDLHHVDLITLKSTPEDPEVIWRTLGDNPMLESLDPAQPDCATTDITSRIASIVGDLPTSQRLAVVLLTDGQHNATGPDATSPVQLAKLLGAREVPIYPIGIGSADPPQDLSILGVKTPESVFADDRVKGQIVIKDNMPEGKPINIGIQIEGETVWDQTVISDRSGARSIDFDFAIKGIVEDRLAASVTGSTAVSMPLPMEVKIQPVEDELREDNNEYSAYIRAITRPRRALLIDGRPRWEIRYVRNMFDRDDHWEVNHVLATTDGRDHQLDRGPRVGEFPSTRDQLFGYDLIILGEVPRNAFTSQELEWINQFVASRGGGLMLIDGQRGKLRTYQNTDLETLLPVQWMGEHRDGLRQARLKLTGRGSATSALAFEGDAQQTAQQWQKLPAMRWVAPAKALPGCESLIEASTAESEPADALVLRQYGAGTVLYSGFDESWRWRYEVGDRYHAQYWNQVATHVMEPPYAVHDRLASLDTGGFLYQPGESAEFKVRLRDEQGNPVVDADVDAILYRDDEVVATIPLAGGASTGGVFRGNSNPLEPGNYRVGLQSSRYTEEQLGLQAEFLVHGDQTGELNVLYCNETLLEQMADLSGGKYLREEQAQQLSELLAPYADGKEKTTELLLWRSWMMFLPLVGLFTVEWFIRKKLGLM